MANLCCSYQVKGCPASFYMACPAPCRPQELLGGTSEAVLPGSEPTKMPGLPGAHQGYGNHAPDRG